VLLASWQVQKQSSNRPCTVYSTQTPRYCLAAEAQKNDVESGRFVSIPRPTFVLGRNPCPDRLATTVEQTADFQTLQFWTFTTHPPWTQRAQRPGNMGRHRWLGLPCKLSRPFPDTASSQPLLLPLWPIGGISERYKRWFSRQPWLTSFPRHGTPITGNVSNPNRRKLWRQMG
jgi:hypothetical protein